MCPNLPVEGGSVTGEGKGGGARLRREQPLGKKRDCCSDIGVVTATADVRANVNTGSVPIPAGAERGREVCG